MRRMAKCHWLLQLRGIASGNFHCRRGSSGRDGTLYDPCWSPYAETSPGALILCATQ